MTQRLISNRCILNSAGIRTEYRNNEEFLVAPVSSINVGVLAGSQGPLYYPAEEVGNNPKQWDGMPLVVYHPHHLGQPVSAKHPGILDKQGIGEIRNSQFKNNKLKHEAWINVAKAMKVDEGRDIINSLRSGNPVEVSTGLYTDNEDAPAGSTFNGRPYTHVARNYVPDHLAILPSQKGACSIKDGCGLLVNSSTGIPGYMRIGNRTIFIGNSQPRTTSSGHFAPKTHTMANKKDVHGQATQGYDSSDDNDREDMDHEDETGAELTMPDRDWDKVTKNARLWYTYNRDWPQAKRDKLDKKSFAGPHQSFPITSQADVDSAAKLIGHADDPEAVKSRIKGIAKKKGLKVPDSWTTNDEVDGDGISSTKKRPPQKGNRVKAAQIDEETGGEDVDDAGTETEVGPVKNKRKVRNMFGQPVQASKDAAAMSMQADHPQAQQHAMSALDSAREGDNGAASNFHLKAAKAHEKAATDSRKDGDDQDAQMHDQASSMHRVASSQHCATMNKAANTRNAGKKTNPKKVEDDNDDTYEGDEDDQEDFTNNDGDNEGNDENEEMDGEGDGGGEMPTTTNEEFNMGKITLSKPERKTLVDKLVSNCQCQSSERETLNSLSDTTLLRMHTAISANAEDDGSETEEDDHGFELVKGGKGSKGVVSGSTGSGGDTGGHEGDSGLDTKVHIKNHEQRWLKSMPASFRSTWNMMVENEKQTKKQLVLRLIANVSDNKKRNLVGNKLMQKSLDELRELADLLPRQQTNNQFSPDHPRFEGNGFVGNEFGGATENAAVDESEMLPLPTINYAELSAELAGSKNGKVR